MKVGDVVIANSWRTPLYSSEIFYCSHYKYTHAIVASIDPFILVSETGDMVWYKIDKDEIIALCQVHPNIMKIVNDRMESEKNNV